MYTKWIASLELRHKEHDYDLLYNNTISFVCGHTIERDNSAYIDLLYASSLSLTNTRQYTSQ